VDRDGRQRGDGRTSRRVGAHRVPVHVVQRPADALAVQQDATRRVQSGHTVRGAGRNGRDAQSRQRRELFGGTAQLFRPGQEPSRQVQRLEVRRTQRTR